MTLMIRPAAVAGRFYPDRPEELRACIDTLLKNAHLTMTRTGDAHPRPSSCHTPVICIPARSPPGCMLASPPSPSNIGALSCSARHIER